MSETPSRREHPAVRILGIVWTTAFILGGAAIGAMVGWSNAGLVGAIALGVVGAIFGGMLSQPQLLLQLLT